MLMILMLMAPSQIGDIITSVDRHPVRQIDDITISYIESIQ